MLHSKSVRINKYVLVTLVCAIFAVCLPSFLRLIHRSKDLGSPQLISDSASRILEEGEIRSAAIKYLRERDLLYDVFEVRAEKRVSEKCWYVYVIERDSSTSGGHCLVETDFFGRVKSYVPGL